MAEFNGKTGVWRTIGGRRVFIEDGDDLKTAMEKSGKFKDLKKDSNKEKYASTKHEGFGDYNDDYIPVYDNKIDYTGDFSRADLTKVSNKELTEALNKQSELYNSAVNEKIGDQRTRNGKMDKIFNTAKQQQYEAGMKKLNEEMQKRNMPRYNIYGDNGEIMVSSPTKEMADKQLANMYEYDRQLQQEYGWEKLPKYTMKKENKTGFENESKIKTITQEETYHDTLKKHDLDYNDSEFKRHMLGRMESDIKYYLGNGTGYTNHLWAKDEDEHINIMEALYNTLPDKEKPNWMSENTISEYGDKIRSMKSLKQRYKDTYNNLQNTTNLSGAEILEILKKIDQDKK